MGYRELLEALDRQVGEEKAKLLVEADRRSERILGEAKREVERLEATFAAEEYREAHLEREKLIAEVAQASSLASLSSRRAAVETVRKQVMDRLGALRGKPSYRKLMETLMEEVLREMPEVGKWVVDRRDVALVQQILKEKKNAVTEVTAGDEGLGGVTALSKDGRARVQNTFESRLAKAWMGLEAGIGAHLTSER